MLQISYPDAIVTTILPISVCLSTLQEMALKPPLYGTLCGTGTTRSHRIKINL